MGKKSGPSADPRLAENVERLGNISQEDWDWFKNTYIPGQMENQGKVQSTSDQLLSQYLNKLIPSQEGQYEQTADAASQTAQTALGQMGKAGQTGDQIYNTWNQSYAPIYGQIADEAAAKGGQADQDYQAMLARGDVAQAFQNSQGQVQRYLAQYGQNPLSGASTAGMRAVGINQAAQEAAAQTAARQAAANLGWTYRQQAAQVGQGLLSAGNQAYETSQNSGMNAINSGIGAINAGNSLGQTYKDALGVATAPINSGATIGSGVAQGAGAATGAASAASGAVNQQQAIQSQAQQAGQASTGAMVGTGIATAGTVAAVMI